jgi:hypothetical protein
MLACVSFDMILELDTIALDEGNTTGTMVFLFFVFLVLRLVFYVFLFLREKKTVIILGMLDILWVCDITITVFVFRQAFSRIGIIRTEYSENWRLRQQLRTYEE